MARKITMAQLKAQLKDKREALKSVSATVTALQEQISKLREEISLAKARELGILAGRTYKAIPKHHPGEVIQGQCRQVTADKYGDRSAMVLLLVSGQGKRAESVRHLRLDDYDFEQVKEDS